MNDGKWPRHPDHFIPRDAKRVCRIAVFIDWTEVWCEPCVLEIRLVVFLVFIFLLTIAVVVVIVVAIFSSHLFCRIAAPFAVAREPPGTSAQVGSCYASASVGRDFGVRLGFWTFIVCFVVAELWRAFGHVDSKDPGNFMTGRGRVLRR